MKRRRKKETELCSKNKEGREQLTILSSVIFKTNKPFECLYVMQNLVYLFNQLFYQNRIIINILKKSLEG